MTAILRRASAAIPLALLATFALGADAPTVTRAWSRATPPGMDVGVAYLTIDGGSRPDRLVAASTPRAAMVHLHSVEESGGVVRMRAIDGVDIPAGKRVMLAPQGTHLMLMGLTGPLAAGERYLLRLRFATAGERTVEVEVRAVGDGAPPAPSTH